MRKNRGKSFAAIDAATGDVHRFAASRARNQWIANDPNTRTVYPVKHSVRRANRRSPESAAHTIRIDGEWLRRARETLDVTQAELGAELGLSKTEVYRKEKMQRPLTTAQVLAVECLLRRAGKWPILAGN